MNPNVLDFERPIIELEEKIEELQAVDQCGEVGLAEEVSHLRQKLTVLIESIFSDLSPWQIAQLARHPLRPHSMDFIGLVFAEFDELHGDRHQADDRAIIGGLARLDGQPLMVIAHEKGRDVKMKVRRNFGMPKPEGYRKALRLMELAEKFQLPVVTLIDTPGAFPGIDAEERGQSEAIACCIQRMAHLKVPIVATVIGEGGSGGALAIGVSDHLQMFQYSTYSVISPEGCASILWKDPKKAPEAAHAMGLTAQQLYKQRLIDEILPEPLGGAHKDMVVMAQTLRSALLKNLQRLRQLSTDDLLERRFTRIMATGEEVSAK